MNFRCLLQDRAVLLEAIQDVLADFLRVNGRFQVLVQQGVKVEIGDILTSGGVSQRGLVISSDQLFYEIFRKYLISGFEIFKFFIYAAVL